MGSGIEDSSEIPKITRACLKKDWFLDKKEKIKINYKFPISLKGN